MYFLKNLFYFFENCRQCCILLCHYFWWLFVILIFYLQFSMNTSLHPFWRVSLVICIEIHVFKKRTNVSSVFLCCLSSVWTVLCKWHQLIALLKNNPLTLYSPHQWFYYKAIQICKRLWNFQVMLFSWKKGFC